MKNLESITLPTIICTIVIFFAPNPAYAADISVASMNSVNASPVAAPFTWDGFYVGVSGGYAIGGTDRVYMKVTESPEDPFSRGGKLNIDLRESGRILGAHAGYNHQYGLFFLGIEGDISCCSLKAAGSANGFVSDATVSDISLVLSNKMDLFSTVRLRTGISVGNILAYATGGIAFIRGETSSNFFSPGEPFREVHMDYDNTGYAIGIGIEYALNINWSLRGEYIYTGFSNQKKYVALATGGANYQINDNFQIFRMGINYNFK